MKGLLYSSLLVCTFVFLPLIAACSSPEETQVADVEVTREVTKVVEAVKEVTREVTVEVTRIVEKPVTVTFTPGPSPTPTETHTPTVTSTFTPSPTPFNTAGCVNLRSVPNYWNRDPHEFYPIYDALDGKCVKFYASERIGLVTTDYGWEPIVPNFVVDEMTPPEIKGIPQYSTVWGIWKVLESGDYDVLLRRVEPFTILRQPIEDDGFYMVGVDWDISPGQWKSLWPPGTVDNCYWARTNPDTGNIKANHFGQAGVYVRIYEGDLFESDDCAPWVFVAP